jgi:PAS domain S-box-containing protein
MNEGALTLSPEGIILYGNAHFSKLIGRPLEHIVGKPLGAFLPEENSEIVEALLKEGIKGVLQRELTVVRKDGSEVPTVASVGPLRLDESSALVVTLTDISERKRSEERQKLLVAELDHRTRNLLAVVNSLLEETLASYSSIDHFAAVFKSRLAALSRVQGLLSRGEADAVTVGELVRMEVRALGAAPGTQRVLVDGPEVALPNRSVQILALALHELATNARKHGGLGTHECSLTVTWQVKSEDEERRLALEWRERRAATRKKKSSPTRRGFGQTLIEEALPYSSMQRRCSNFRSFWARRFMF